MDEENKIIALTYMARLLYDCPRCSDDIFCEIIPLRKMSFKKRLEWLDNLTDEELFTYYHHFADCIVQKETNFNQQNCPKLTELRLLDDDVSPTHLDQATKIS